MNYTAKSIKRTLKKTINEISAHSELFVKNPGRDFTRTRKLPFKQTVKAIVSMSGKSLRGEIMDFFNMDISAPTVSAFVQQRNKISYHAFEIIHCLLPYEITLLSNVGAGVKAPRKVLLPYEITLLSNSPVEHRKAIIGLLPYEITLLSNVNLIDLNKYIGLLPYEITLLSNFFLR